MTAVAPIARPVGAPAPIAAPGGAGLIAPSLALASHALAKLDADLGQVQTGRNGQDRTYRRRLDLLSEAVTPSTFALIAAWLTSTRRASAQTKRQYVDDIRRVWAGLARELGHERFFVGCLTAGHVRAWRLRAEAGGVSARSIARYLSTLSSLHRYAAEHLDEPPRNPVARDDRPVIDTGNTATSTPVLELAEMQAVVDRAQTELDVLVVTLLYTLAGRITEMCAADVTDLKRRGKHVLLNVTRKGSKQRLLPLPAPVAQLLDRHIGDRTKGPLLLDTKGDRLDRHDVARMLARMGRHAGVLEGRAVTPHVLRASRITHMLDDQVPLADVQEFADHDNPATTVGYRDRRGKGQRIRRHADAGATVFASATSRWLADDRRTEA